MRLDLKGRGRALDAVWRSSDARVLAYMDVDLSTDLAAHLPLVAPLLSGHSDLAIGTRLARGSRVVRGTKRELISRSYNTILHVALGARFSDAQCGFKAIRADRARELLPLVRDRAWFFDTELLVLAERAGMRIHEVPVDWVDDPDSRVDIVATALADLRGVARLLRDVRTRPQAVAVAGPEPSFGGQVVRFASIGVLSTLAYALLFLVFRSMLGAQAANALALLLTAIGNTAANRRFTFAIRGSANNVRHQFQGLIVFGLALGLTSSSLELLHVLVPDPTRAVELAALVAAACSRRSSGSCCSARGSSARGVRRRRCAVSATTPEAVARAERAARPSRLRALLRGRADDPAWARPALIGLLAGTAFLYLVDLAASGYANAFYSAAVEAASHSWKALFFGSFDASNFITVDKPPAALWVMDLSARLFGVSSWSILAPQALEGVAAVALLYATVRRRFSAPAGLLAGAVFALTPVAALMFRFNNPDALLTLLLVAAAYSLTRALEHGGTRWLVLAGVLIGFGFLTKMLQAFVVVPGFVAVYLLAAPVSIARRLLQLLASGAAMFAAAAWWVAIVTLWPASSRPYIGGSQDNSILNLIFGYNGLGRITGNERGERRRRPGLRYGNGCRRRGGREHVGPDRHHAALRLRDGDADLVAPARSPLLHRRPALGHAAGRTDRREAAPRCSSGVPGSVVTGLVFSFMQGIIHPYYTVVLAPAIGALVGIGVTWTWSRRDNLLARLALATALVATAAWGSSCSIGRLRGIPRCGSRCSSAESPPRCSSPPGRPSWGGNRAVGRAVLLASLVFALAAPAAYAAQTASTATRAPPERRPRRIRPAGRSRRRGGRRGFAPRAARPVGSAGRPAVSRRPAAPGLVAAAVRARLAVSSTRAHRARRLSPSSRRTPRATAGSRQPSVPTAPPASSSASASR